MREVRIWFVKRGEARYISHLDLNRFMLRALRRTKLPIWYTEGYNPHPYLTFSLPLSLGFESVCESMDLRIMQDDCSNEEVFRRLSAAMPESLAILKVTDPVMKQKCITAADYELEFSLPQEKADPLWEFLSGDLIPVKKNTKKGGEKQINLKDHLHHIRMDRTQCGVRLSVRLDAGNIVNINPMLLVTAIQEALGITCSDVSVTRKDMLDGDGRSFC